MICPPFCAERVTPARSAASASSGMPIFFIMNESHSLLNFIALRFKCWRSGQKMGQIPSDNFHPDGDNWLAVFVFVPATLRTSQGLGQHVRIMERIKTTECSRE